MKNHVIAILLLLGYFAPVFAQTDTIPPTIVCKQTMLQVNLMPTGTVSLWAEKYMYDTVYDNESVNLAFGLRKLCLGTGFPEESEIITFYYADFYDVEVWARDAVGNAASCITNIFVSDHLSCSLAPPFSVTLKTEAGEGIKHAKIEFKGKDCKNDSCTSQLAYDGLHNPGMYTIIQCGPQRGGNFSLYPQRNDSPLNGVTTYDLVLISKHILGIEPLDSPYKLIAADANLDGQITTADVVLLRKLILGIIPRLPSDKSWRFVKNGHLFLNYQDPQHPPFPERIWVPFVVEPPWYSNLYSFVGVKIGDVNGSAVPGD